jgi:hypothetical protein
MKLIDTLNEALGVPSGIVEVASKIYDKIVSGKFTYIINDDEDISMEGNKPNIIVDTFKIGDEIYNKVMYLIIVKPHPKADEVDLIGMSAQSTITSIGVGKFANKRDDVIRITFNFVCPGDNESPSISDKDIRNNINKIFFVSKSNIISNITHELKHVYDNTKKKTESLPSLSKYNVHKQYIGWGIIPISNFCFSLYFMSVTETLVRPSELAALIQTKGITKQNFLSFLKNNETYSQLNEIKNMTYESFYNDLFNYIDIIKELYKIKGKRAFEAFELLSDKEIVDIFLTNIREKLQNEMIEFMSKRILQGMPVELAKMFNRREELMFLKKAASKVFKYENNKDFYSAEINYNAKKADFVIRKLAKLYSMAK